MRHTIVIEAAEPEEAPAYLRTKTPDEIEDGLTRHVQAWAGWPIEVVEYHQEQMTENEVVDSLAHPAPERLPYPTGPERADASRPAESERFDTERLQFLDAPPEATP
jgi:hypothetical protein